MSIRPEAIPEVLKQHKNWIVWKTESRDGKSTKVPYSVATGRRASSTDATTWNTFEAAIARHEFGSYGGIGYVFSPDDPYCGVDLDGCRDKETGAVAPWAREIITGFNTYSEVSPSGEGVKLFMLAKWPRANGKKTTSLPFDKVGAKEPGIEVYDRARYFTMTGWRLSGLSAEVEERQQHIELLADEYFPEASRAATNEERWQSDDAVVERARKYVAMLAPAVSGQGGHNRTFHAACVLVCGFGLDIDQAYPLLVEWNEACQPPWSERELRHKLDGAAKQPGERNYLRDARPDQWSRISVPQYRDSSHSQQQQPQQQPLRVTTLADASLKYLEELKQGNRALIELGLPDLDHAIAGGVEFGEMIILAARPSHGKSAVALQIVHHATKMGLPALLLSEEMSALALGKRAIQYASDVAEEHWRTSDTSVRKQVESHFEHRAPCYVVESCGSAQRAADTVRDHVRNKGVKIVVVDYAQLLTSPGKARYEQVTNTSIVLRQLATECKVILIVLCQLNRAIESRQKFVPTLSDIKDTGQLEQDADVIMFLVWPHRIDSTKNKPDEYLFFISKNRNRAINAPAVKCVFKPGRQMFIDSRLANAKAYNADEWEPQSSYADSIELFENDNGHEDF